MATDLKRRRILAGASSLLAASYVGSGFSRTVSALTLQEGATLPPGQTNVPFIHVEEDMTVPMPPGREFEQYVIYVGFDPEGAALEQKKKPARPAPRPAERG